MRPNREYFWRDRFLNYVIKSVAATSKRSTSYIREEHIVSVSSNFLTQISHGTRKKCRKTRAIQRDFTIVDSLALRADRVKPITCALRACFLGHYRMARMSQSASSCGLASWMRPQQLRHFDGSRCSLAKIAIPYTILPLAQFTCLLINQRCSADSLLGCANKEYMRLLCKPRNLSTVNRH